MQLQYLLYDGLQPTIWYKSVVKIHQGILYTSPDNSERAIIQHHITAGV